MRKTLVMLGAALAMTAIDVAGGGLNKDGDFQGWYIMAVSSSSKGWKLRVEDESRGGDSWHKLYYNHLDVGVSRALCPWFEAGINFRQVEELKDGEREHEDRVHVNGIFKWTMRSWTFSDRHRFELRDFEAGQDKWRYRNRLTACLPVTFVDGKIRPYLSDEIFVDLHGEGLLSNRIYAGVEMRFLDQLKSDISYLWQSKYCDAEWVETHAINLKCEWMF